MEETFVGGLAPEVSGCCDGQELWAEGLMRTRVQDCWSVEHGQGDAVVQGGARESKQGE